MSVKEKMTIPETDAQYDDLGFFPRVVNTNYNAYNCSVDSRYSEMPGSRGNSMKKLDSAQKFGKESLSKKRVKFNMTPEVIFVKSYKYFNLTGKHKNSCECKIF